MNIFNIIFIIMWMQYINCNPPIYYVIRNKILKKIIFTDIDKAKILFNKLKIIYNASLTKYYEINDKYYSLSETDKTIVETVLSLTF